MRWLCLKSINSKQYTFLSQVPDAELSDLMLFLSEFNGLDLDDPESLQVRVSWGYYDDEGKQKCYYSNF